MTEVDSHLAESGEDPLEAFGPPDRYAARLLRSRWHTARFITGMAAGVAAGLLVGAMAVALSDGDATVTIRGGTVLVGAVILLATTVVVLPAVHNRLPSGPARPLVGVCVAVLGAGVAWVLGPTTGIDARVLLTLSRAGALATSLGLLTVAVAAMAGPYLRGWLRGASPLSRSR